MGATSPVIIEIKEDNKIKKYSKQNKKFSKIKKFPKIIIKQSEQLYNSICRIYDKNNTVKGTGFFMQINLENNLYYFLITYNNIISSEQIDNEETIIIYFLINGKEEKRNIKIDSNRTNFVFFDPLDITIIEILDSDNISKERFLCPDLNYKKEYKFYLNKSYYIAGFEKNNKKFISSCEIKNIIGFEFIHNINKGTEALGSLICSKDDFRVIGINKGVDKDCIDNNYGTFIGKILDYLENSRKGLNIRNDISIYKGMINLGLRHGEGTGFYIDGGIYIGDWINDVREGKGTMFYSNGNVYIGEWKNDRREGKGIFYFLKGSTYEGEFKNNIIDGFGELKASTGHRSWVFIGTLRIGSLDNPNFDAIYLFNH